MGGLRGEQVNIGNGEPKESSKKEEGGRNQESQDRNDG